MHARLSRRDFLTGSAVAGAGLLLASGLDAAPAKTTLRKALIGVPGRQVFKSWQAAGFEGMETTRWDASPQEAATDRKMAESAGMQIHGVVFGWGNLNGGESAMADTVAKMKIALRAAQGYGAGTVLFVPSKIGDMPIPEPGKLRVRFDEATGHLQEVVAGDNAMFRKYIDAHNEASDATREGVRRLIPTAAKVGVTIAIQNVWNNLWLTPELHANLVASFNSVWVRAYFNIGNHVKFGPPQEWIRVLGKLLAKCHVKDFKLGKDGRDGDFCNLREGSVDWPAVRKALDEVGYEGWLTAEGGDLSPKEAAKRLDLIIAGK